MISRIVDILNSQASAIRETSALFLWSALFLGRICYNNANACEKAMLARATDTLQILLSTHDSSEVRAACAYALGTYLSSSHVGNETGERRTEQAKEAATILIRSLHDGSPLVRREVLVALQHFLTNFTQSNNSGNSSSISLNRLNSSIYKTMFDKVTEAIRHIIAFDPCHDMALLAENIINDIQKPNSTKFFSWCCSRFRVPNTIVRDLGSGISPPRGTWYTDEEENCFARGCRYWKNNCVRTSAGRLADFQHIHEIPLNTRLSNAIPVVMCLHPYEDYLTVANSHGNLNFYDLNGNSNSKNSLKVMENDLTRSLVQIHCDIDF